MPMIWTALALSRDLPVAVAMPAECAGTDLALWRAASGKLSLWSDRCPHRGMRLSHGFVRGEFLSCIYHGWRYDGAGQCRKIPAHPDLEPPAAVRTTGFSVTEADGVIWGALEQPEAPPPAIPGYLPLRSLTLLADAGDLPAHGLHPTPSPILLNGQKALVLTQPLNIGMGLHVLIAPGADAKAASRGLEDLRRHIEANARGIAA